MKRLRYLLLGVFFICSCSTIAQTFDDSLYIHLYNFQVIKGEVKDTELKGKSIKAFFRIENLIDIDTANSELFRIYKFHNLEHEEALTSFLVVEKDVTEIYDIQSFDALVERILDANVCEKIKTKWVKEILKMQRIYYEDFDMGRLVIQKDYGSYHYFIPISNIKKKEGILKQ